MLNGSHLKNKINNPYSFASQKIVYTLQRKQVICFTFVRKHAQLRIFGWFSLCGVLLDVRRESPLEESYQSPLETPVSGHSQCSGNMMQVILPELEVCSNKRGKTIPIPEWTRLQPQQIEQPRYCLYQCRIEPTEIQEHSVRSTEK